MMISNITNNIRDFLRRLPYYKPLRDIYLRGKSISLFIGKDSSQAGWKAILLEPLPGPFQKLLEKYEDNRNVTCLNLAISNTQGIQDFFIGSDGPDGMLSTLCREDNLWTAQARSDEVIKVKVDTISNVLINSNVPRDFSLLLIDTEGMDYECLLGLNFNIHVS